MGAATIPVDLLNPGQVFACLGLMEAAEVLCGPCEGAFTFRGYDSAANFAFNVPGAANPLSEVLDYLWVAEARAVAPNGSSLAAKEDGVHTVHRDDAVYPCPAPDSPSALPARLVGNGRELLLEHWADGSTRDNLKFWAGAGGYSGAALTRDALSIIQSAGPEQRDQAQRAPFDLAAPMSSSYRFDWRRDYIPIDVGFSPNNQGAFTMVGYPVVEVLAALGLQHARPARVTPRDKLRYRYAVSSASLPTEFVRAVLGGQALGFPTRTFQMRLGWPGQEGQARCIVDAQEEFSR